jgi:hypothetical protein
MADEPELYNLKAIRRLLEDAFTGEELRDLFYLASRPELHQVVKQFLPGDSQSAMVRKAVRYCDSRSLLAEMLVEVKAVNPQAYARHEEMCHAPPGTWRDWIRQRWRDLAFVATAILVLGGMLALLLALVLPQLVDADGDGLTNAEESRWGTHQMMVDSDHDGLSDAEEVHGITEPNNPDTDGDGLTDGKESELGTNPLARDTDGDALGDGLEVYVVGTDPLVSDTDGDGEIDSEDLEPLGPFTPPPASEE